MRTLIEYIRITLFLGGALIGVQIPSFVEQYGQRLESHLLESKTSLEGFQADADKYFNGNIEELLRHYAKNSDPVINDGGDSIASLYSRAKFLGRSWSEFNAGFQQRYWHAFAKPVKTIRAEAWKSYDFSVRLDVSGIAWALALGFILSALIELCLNVVAVVFTFNKRAYPHKLEAPTMNPDI